MTILSMCKCLRMDSCDVCKKSIHTPTCNQRFVNNFKLNGHLHITKYTND